MTKKSASEAARALAAMRKNHRGGRPKIMRRCPQCRQSFSARELRRHKSQCVVKEDRLPEIAAVVPPTPKRPKREPRQNPVEPTDSEKEFSDNPLANLLKALRDGPEDELDEHEEMKNPWGG